MVPWAVYNKLNIEWGWGIEALLKYQCRGRKEIVVSSTSFFISVSTIFVPHCRSVNLFLSQTLLILSWDYFEGETMQ